MPKCDRVTKTIVFLAQQPHVQSYQTLMDWMVATYGKNAWYLLVACLLSLRARDAMVLKMFPIIKDRVKAPQAIDALSMAGLEKMIRSIGFYRAKARTLKHVAREIIDRFDGDVPNSPQNMMSIKGIGQKTANLVLWYAYGIQAGIAVDIHVHRVCNRLGVIETKTAEQTRKQLERCVPQKLWPAVNHACVALGQQICVSQSPWCSKCPMRLMCLRRGVRRSR
ncbi:MAG: hypothetical protein UU47_C0006G0006 [candidate division TM6 bacterium GW2011_GWE2_41_16]|nr:MAG: hypothetical protein UU47_C0006G0006 [candidate division TM6 bacterium GW2011_GWE2_41_16]